MAARRATTAPGSNGHDGDKETQDQSPHFTPLETLAAAAAASAGPATAPAVTTEPPADPPTRETEQPTVETIEDIADNTGNNTGNNARETSRPTRPHASASRNDQGCSSASAYHRRDCIVHRTVNRYPPYLPETPDPVLGQLWIDHIDSLLGVRTESQREEMRYCIEQTDRVLHLANNILRQQRELLADLRQIATEEYHSGDSSSELSEVIEFGDEVEGNGEGDGDGYEPPANGCGTADE